MPRPWYKPHFTTVFALFVVAAALFTANLTSRAGSNFFDADWGWPATYCSMRSEFGVGSRVVTHSAWNALGLAADIVSSIILLAATAFVCESWRRSGLRPWQFNFRSLLVMMTIAVLTWWLQSHADELFWWWFRERNVDWGFDQVGSAEKFWHPWYIVGPILFSEGCALYCLGVFVVGLVRLLRALRTTAESAS